MYIMQLIHLKNLDEKENVVEQSISTNQKTSQKKTLLKIMQINHQLVLKINLRAPIN